MSKNEGAGARRARWNPDSKLKPSQWNIQIITDTGTAILGLPHAPVHRNIMTRFKE